MVISEIGKAISVALVQGYNVILDWPLNKALE